MNITLKVWRQKGPAAPGGLVEYTVSGVVPEMSFLEMLDTLNEQLIAKGEDPLAFDSDCREGICGMCDLVIDGQAHGPDKGATTCQLHMRRYKDGAVVTVEPFRSKAFPLVKDLVVDRSSFDRIQAAGGFVSINTGNAVDGNNILIPHDKAEKAMKNLKLNPQLSERTCDKCNAPMAILYNKRGKFLGCSRYPECKNTTPLDGPREKSEVVETAHVCPS